MTRTFDCGHRLVTFALGMLFLSGCARDRLANWQREQSALTAGTKIDCGSTVAVSPFIPDSLSGGTSISQSNPIDTSAVVRPAPVAVYQTARTGNFTYTVSGFAASSSHKIRLHFAETIFNAAGARRFNVSINGASVLTNFDVFAAAGAKNKAVVREFTSSANGSGAYTIAFSNVTNVSLLSGLEVVTHQRYLNNDYDGDGKADAVRYLLSDHSWHVKPSSGSTETIQGWGEPTDTLVPGDYDGDGKTDLAIFRPAEGNCPGLSCGFLTDYDPSCTPTHCQASCQLTLPRALIPGNTPSEPCDETTSG